jgi:hypothetical protein
MSNFALLYFGMKIFQQYSLIEKFSISDNNFKNQLLNIKNECYETTQINNSLIVIDTTRIFYYLVK